MAQEASRSLITGASSGIGAVYAEHLARRGHDLVLVARQAERPTELGAQLEREHGISAENHSRNLSTDAEIVAIERRTVNSPEIDILISRPPPRRRSLRSWLPERPSAFVGRIRRAE